VHAEFESFYAASFSRLVGQLALVTGDLHEAEDLVQEAFARASTRWARLRGYDIPEAWVRRVALRHALAVEIALRTLPIRSRQVVVLHYLLGLPVEEVGRELAIPAGPARLPAHRRSAARRSSPGRRRATGCRFRRAGKSPANQARSSCKPPVAASGWVFAPVSRSTRA